MCILAHIPCLSEHVDSQTHSFDLLHRLAIANRQCHILDACLCRYWMIQNDQNKHKHRIQRIRTHILTHTYTHSGNLLDTVPRDPWWWLKSQRLLALYVDDSCYTNYWVKSHAHTSRVTPMNTTCHTYEHHLPSPISSFTTNMSWRSIGFFCNFGLFWFLQVSFAGPSFFWFISLSRHVDRHMYPCTLTLVRERIRKSSLSVYFHILRSLFMYK